MAGKGRGRGANFTFDLQAIGFSRGDVLPETQVQPTEAYPHIDYKPACLLEGEEHDYLLGLKQELRGNMKYLPYYMGRSEQNSSVEKYSIKYLKEQEKKRIDQWTPDWTLLPREMKAVKKKKKKGEKKAKTDKAGTNVDVMKKIEELEKKGDDEKSDEENEEKKKGGEEEEEEEAEVDVDDEEHEEENDYIASYFEDGDDIANSDDNMDEATY